jgi:hypothetical protein
MCLRGSSRRPREARRKSVARCKYAIYEQRANREQLFDLEKDSGEMRNLAPTPALAAVLDDHRKRLRAWCEETRDADFLPRLAASGTRAS